MTNYFAKPGQEVPVSVEVAGNGSVPRDGDGVKLSGENESGAVVTQTTAKGDNAVGVLTTDPEKLQNDENDPADYSAGDYLGEATVVVGNPILWVTPADTYAPTAGDLVDFDAGGEVSEFTDFTRNAFPAGQVFLTVGREYGTVGKIAIVKGGI